MKYNLVYLFIIINIVLITFVELRKKKPRKKEVKVENVRHRHPDRNFVSQELFCDSCKTILKHSLFHLYGKKREGDVITALEDISFPEKDMFMTCNLFIQGFEKELESILINRVDDDKTLEYKLCFEISKACDFENQDENKDNLNLDEKKLNNNSENKEEKPVDL